VAGLVHAEQALLVGGEPAGAGQAGHVAVEGLVEVVCGDRRLVAAGGQQCRLVDGGGQLGGGEPRRVGGHLRPGHVVGERPASGVEAQDLLAPP
jgi:hypothetical protein